MSLVKLAWTSGSSAHGKIHDQLGDLKGRNWTGTSRARVAQDLHNTHLRNVDELNSAKISHEYHKGKVGESDALAHLEKTRAKTQKSARSLGEVINPGGKESVVAGRAKVRTNVPTPKAAAGAEASSLGGKVLQFAKANPLKAAGAAAGIAAAGYGAKKLLEKKQDQPRYYQA